MRMEGFLLGMVIMIVSLSVVLTIALDAYSPKNYNINLSADESTKQLATLQTKANENYVNLQGGYENMRQRTPGQNESAYNPQTGQTEYDLQKSALTALKESHTFLDTFADMVNVFLNQFDLEVSTRGLFIWFFVLLIGIPIVFLLLNSFLRNVL